ncbi:MAG: response regulator [Bacteroidota bacterium]|nr:response regulator [Bacteroidota bacterium]
MDNTEIKIIIAEDNVLIAEHLKDILISYGYNVVGVFHNKIDLLTGLKKYHPDIALLDIKMDSRYTGVEIGEYISKNIDIPFIYITAHSDKQTFQKALKTKPNGYILKPFKDKDISIAIELALDKYVKDSSQGYLKIKVSPTTIKILYSEIMYTEADNNYLKVYTKKQKYLSRNSLVNISNDLDDEIFVQTHRSFIINKNYATKFDDKNVFVNNVKIPVSRKYFDEVSAIFDY